MDVAVGVPLLSGMHMGNQSKAVQTVNGGALLRLDLVASGLQPSPASHCHKLELTRSRLALAVQFQIVGADSQTVEMMLMPDQICRTEPGGMVHMHSSLMPDIGTDGGCGQAVIRCCCVGESFFRLKYANKTSDPVPMAISPAWPAKVLPFDMSTYRGLHIQNGSFVGAVSSNIQFRPKMANSAGAACCGGQGLFFNEMCATRRVSNKTQASQHRSLHGLHHARLAGLATASRSSVAAALSSRRLSPTERRS